MPVDFRLLLQNTHAAFTNGQTQHGLFLLNYAIRYADDPQLPGDLRFDAAVALDIGLVREAQEDCLFAFQGILPETQEAFGLFIVCDGVGGHIHGQEAAALAIETMVESVFSRLLGKTGSEDWIRLLIEGVQAANRAVYLRNQSLQQTTQERATTAWASGTHTAPTHLMGTTMTAALLVHETAYVVNVGDSRTYLYRPQTGLVRITVDHSVVANLFHLAQSRITPEEMYTHPQRNQILRALGTDPFVEVDTFVASLQENAVLLLCSDGLWEMTRDSQIEATLGCDWACAPYMAHRLLALAREGGARDNVGLIVVQVNGRQRRVDISEMATVIQPVEALTRLVALSPSIASPPSRSVVS